MKPEKTEPEGTSLIRRIGEGIMAFFFSSQKVINDPEKEVRFTRSAQATVFFMLTILCLAGGICSLGCIFVNWGPWHYDFKQNWWLTLLTIIPAFIFYRIGVRCIRHAYIILTPLGVEIFPFFNAKKNLRIVFWAEIHHIALAESLLKIHNNKEETSGVILSLKPISKAQHPLLQRAIQGRLDLDKKG